LKEDYHPLSDYGLIGNCRSAALVSNHGSIDWYCIPEFHSPSIFAALLEKNKGGFFLIQPVDPYTSTQNYIDLTNVIETVFETSEAKVKLTDCYVAMEEADKQKQLFPDHEIIRTVECIEGSVNMRYVYHPTVYYGKTNIKLVDHHKMGLHFCYKENIVVLQSSLGTLSLNKNKHRSDGEFMLNAGERVVFSLSCSTQYPAVIPEVNITALERVKKTIEYWCSWISQCKYEGVFKEYVLRSVLVLKLLTHAPSGAIIAAPTTSLPEEIAGVRNWDYRFCWLRDASFTVRVLIKLGYFQEAHAYMSWILHATRLTQPKLQVVYTVFGNSAIKEKILGWLQGYKKSQPVRIGNQAHKQFQLDVYGEVLDAIFTYSKIVNEFDKGTKRFIIGLGKTLCKVWFEPDEGIWEIRYSRLHHTHSKVMAWVGLDRLIKLCRKYHWDDAPLNDFQRAKELIRNSVEDFGYKKSIESYVKDFDSDLPDACLLTFSLVEYCEVNSARIVSTVDRIQEQLVRNNFTYRQMNIDDGLPGREGAFLLANFWLIENLARQGKVGEAINLFKETLEASSKHFLLSEEVDPSTKELLGNYPQGFSHIGLINAALTITEVITEKE
jgi:GH15 family glucan-1,4-alpha-glucosidase